MGCLVVSAGGPGGRRGQIVELIAGFKAAPAIVAGHVCHKRQAGLYSLFGPFAFHAFKSTAGPARFQCTCTAPSVQVQCKRSAVVMQPAKRGGQQMESAADRTGGMACALQAALRLNNAAFSAHLESACGWVAAWRHKPALAPAVGDAVASRHCLRTGTGVDQGVIRRARTWARLCREEPAGVRCRAGGRDAADAENRPSLTGHQHSAKPARPESR